MPAALLACANCHGRDGRGRPEGGLDPPDLAWRTIRQPRPADKRRARPAYTVALLGRVITMGLDSAGEHTGVGMPRYQLPLHDLADLISYLEVLGTESDPGVGPDVLLLGSLLQPERTAPSLNEAISRVLSAYAAEVNARGGLYQRKIEFVYETVDGSSDQVAPAIAGFLSRRQIFALVAPFIAGFEETLLQVARDQGVPVIGPFAASTPAASDPQRQVFYTHAGLGAQARALAAAAASRAPMKAPTIVHGDDLVSAGAAAEVTAHWVREGKQSPKRVTLRADADDADLDRLIKDLAKDGSDRVVYLGPASLTGPLFRAADRAAFCPSFYLPSALADRAMSGLPTSCDGRIFLSFPYLPRDVTRSGEDLLDRLRRERNLPRDHEATQIACLMALKVLEEGLRRCGRDLSRARLVDKLEQLNEFETGYSRPLTFGPNRRMGSPGAYILSLEDSGRRFRPLGWWTVTESP